MFIARDKNIDSSISISDRVAHLYVGILLLHRSRGDIIAIEIVIIYLIVGTNVDTNLSLNVYEARCNRLCSNQVRDSLFKYLNTGVNIEKFDYSTT